MVKNEIAKAVSNKLDGCTIKDAAAVLEAFEDVIVETLKDNPTETVSVGKLGKFKVKDVPERIGTIMMGSKKGEQYVVPAHKEITFKMSKSSKNI